MKLAPGGRFGDYTVVRLLGRGGMGEVWLLEGASGRQVAAKILESSADHEARKRFLREANLALGVKHPNLVEAYEVGEDPETGICYILMEYVPGGTLADCLKANGALPIEKAVSIVRAISSVLELARQKGVVHRDIKPANIMLDAEDNPKLADLGIARVVRAEGETTTVTQAGALIGTPAYMAPEQMLDSHDVDTRADIYSLGIVFYEMLTGERPNKDDTIVQLMAKAVKGEPLPDVRTLRPEVSASLAQLLNMMVAPDKDGRISTPGQITNALAIIERGGELKGSRWRRKSFRWKFLLLVPILAALAVAAVLSLPKKSAPPAAAKPSERTTGPEVARTNAVANQNQEWIAKSKYGLKWMRGYVPGSMRKKIRICTDVSHGGYGSYDAQREMNDYYLFDAPEKAEWVSCWYDLTKDGLSDVNVLWIEGVKSDFSKEEFAAVDRFLDEKGIVFVFYSSSEPASYRLLEHYGLRVVDSIKGKDRSYSFCGSEHLQSVRLRGVAGQLERIGDGTLGCGTWVPLLVSTQGKVVAAACTVGPNEGTGKIFCLPRGILDERRNDDNRKFLNVLLSSAVGASERILRPPQGSRSILEAPFRKTVGPFQFLCGPNTLGLTEKNVAFFDRFLPVYLKNGGVGGWDSIERTCFMTMGRSSGDVPYAEGGVRSWSGCYDGFPETEGGMVELFTYNLMSFSDLTRPARGKDGTDVNFLLVDRICRDLGYVEYADKRMDEAISRGRRIDPQLTEIDFRQKTLRSEDGKLLLSIGESYQMRQAKFLAAMRELIGDDRQKYAKFMGEWRQLRPKEPRDSDEVGVILTALEHSVGEQARTVFAKYRISAVPAKRIENAQ